LTSSRLTLLEPSLPKAHVQDNQAVVGADGSRSVDNCPRELDAQENREHSCIGIKRFVAVDKGRSPLQIISNRLYDFAIDKGRAESKTVGSLAPVFPRPCTSISVPGPIK